MKSKNNNKYNEYVILCNEANETIITQDNKSWPVHKGKLIQNKPKESIE